MERPLDPLERLCFFNICRWKCEQFTSSVCLKTMNYHFFITGYPGILLKSIKFLRFLPDILLKSTIFSKGSFQILSPKKTHALLQMPFKVWFLHSGDKGDNSPFDQTIWDHFLKRHGSSSLLRGGTIFFPEPFFISEVKLSFCLNDTVDGSEIRRAPVEVDSLSHNLQGLIHPRWLFGISSINSISASRQSVGEKSLQHGEMI